MKKILLAGMALGMGVSPAFAEYIQTIGIGTRSRALSGAVVSDSSPSDAYYTNPAGAAFFDKPVVGGGGALLDTRGSIWADKDGSYDVEGTLSNANVGLLPEGFAYYPVTDKFVLGLGVGVPYALGGDLQDGVGAPHSSAQLIQLVSVDMSPVVAIKVSEKFSIGASINVQILENFEQDSVVSYEGGESPGQALDIVTGGNLGGVVDGILGIIGLGNVGVGDVLGAASGLNGDADDTLSFKTKSDTYLPLPPSDYRMDLDTIGFTLGAQYKATDRLAFGVAYRSKQETTYELDAVLSADGEALAYSDAELVVDLPAHLQVGASYDVIPGRLKVLGDVQMTFWSDAKVFGQPSAIYTPNWTSAAASPTDLGGLIDAVVGGVTAELLSAQGTAIVLDYQAEDTISFRLGAEYTPEMLPDWKLRVGYQFDPTPFPDDTVDAITYSTDRHYLTAGAGYSMLDENGSGLIVDFSGTFVYLVDRTQEDLKTYTSYESLSPLDGNGVIEGASSGESMDFGGTAYGFGATFTYVF